LVDSITFTTYIYICTVIAVASFMPAVGVATMSFGEVTCGGPAPPRTASAPGRFHDLLFAVLIELHLVGRPATREEMNDFIMKDLVVVDILMVPSA
jgi:hypothetical protein